MTQPGTSVAAESRCERRVECTKSKNSGLLLFGFGVNDLIYHAHSKLHNFGTLVGHLRYHIYSISALFYVAHIAYLMAHNFYPRAKAIDVYNSELS